MNQQGSSYIPVSEDDLAWLGHDPIPAAPYYDPAYFELEREAVFKRTWLQIGHSCEIPEPGDFIVRPVEIAKASVLIVRGKDKQIRAFHNVCTHRGTQLVDEAQGRRAAFSCPYHKWTFDHEGQLRSAPDFERFALNKEDCGLSKVSVDVCGGLIFINFDQKPAQSLREFLAPVAERLDEHVVNRATTFSEYVYEIDANWKVNYDNFQENYHLRFIHPRTGAAACGDDNPFGYPVAYNFYGPHRSQTLWKNPVQFVPAPAQGRALRVAAEFAGAESGAAAGAAKLDFKAFPNLFIIGQTGYFFTHCVMPVGPEKSRGVIRIYWNGEDETASQRYAREYVMGTLRDVHAEDRGIICAGQRGLSSGAIKHVHFQTHESLCRHLFNTVNGMVEAYKAEVRGA